MIEINQLEGVHFRLPAAAIPAGELAAFVAPTLACAREFVDLLLGLTRPREGAVRVFGESVGTLDEAASLALRSRLGFAAQAEGLIGHLALWENILLGPGYHQRQTAAGLDARVRTLLGWCGWPVEEARTAFRRQPEEATPFERATAVWLRALLGGPELLVCENLFGGLAAEQRRRLIDASVSYLSENPSRCSVFVLVGDRLIEELQPTTLFYLSLRGDFRAEAQA